MAHKIPKEITAFAQVTLNALGEFEYEHAGELRYLGERDGVTYYTPYYPDAEIGYPSVFSMNKKGKCREHTREEALALIASFTDE